MRLLPVQEPLPSGTPGWLFYREAETPDDHEFQGQRIFHMGNIAWLPEAEVLCLDLEASLALPPAILTSAEIQTQTRKGSEVVSYFFAAP